MTNNLIALGLGAVAGYVFVTLTKKNNPAPVTVVVEPKVEPATVIATTRPLFPASMRKAYNATQGATFAPPRVTVAQ